MRKFVIVLFCLVVIMQLVDCGKDDIKRSEGQSQSQVRPDCTGNSGPGRQQRRGVGPGMSNRQNKRNQNQNPNSETEPLVKRSVDSQLDGNPSDRSRA
jgi:hypothetical protein